MKSYCFWPKKFALVALALFVIAVGSNCLLAFADEECSACMKDHTHLCERECADNQEPDCQKTCVDEKCRSFCDPAFKKCVDCQNSSRAACFEQCPNSGDRDARIMCFGACTKNACHTACEPAEKKLSAK
ncbi:MAG: hypothetical protein KDD64_02610 [Bdellovibrionales bacterium]|nr:hypothetical protein [Bdellovibrionales bacterium]